MHIACRSCIDGQNDKQNKLFRPVATPAFYGYSGSSLTVSQNIAKTVNKPQKLARQKIATIYPAI